MILTNLMNFSNSLDLLGLFSSWVGLNNLDLPFQLKMYVKALYELLGLPKIRIDIISVLFLISEFPPTSSSTHPG